MKKSRKVLLITGLVLITAVVVLVVIATTGSLRYEAVGRLFVTRMKYSLGRNVTVSHVDGSIIAGINAHNMKVAPAGGNMSEPEFIADNMDISYRLLPMLVGKTVINKMEINNFTIHVSRSGEVWSFQDIIEHMKQLMATANYHEKPVLPLPAGLAAAAGKSAAATVPSLVEIERIVLKNGRLVYSDQSLLPGVQVIVEDVNGYINGKKGFTTGDGHLEGKLKTPAPGKILADARIKEGYGPSLEATLEIENTATLDSIISSAMNTLSTVVKPEKGKLNLNISASSKQGVFSSQLDVGVSDLAVSLPAMNGLKLTGISGQGTLSAEGFAIKSLALPLGEAGALTFTGTIKDFTNPIINLKLGSEPLDINKSLDYLATIPMTAMASDAFKEFSPSGTLTISGGISNLQPFEIFESLKEPGFKTFALIARIKSEKQIDITSTIDSGSANLTGLPAGLTGLEGDIVFDGFQMTVTGMKGKLGSVPLTLGGSIGVIPNIVTGLPPTISLSATVPGETTVTECLKLLPAEIQKKLETVTFYGQVAVDRISLEGTPAALSVGGKLSIDNGSLLMTPYLTSPLTGITATAAFNGSLSPVFEGAITISNLSARVGSSPITAGGAIKSLTGLELAMTLAAKKLKLQDIASHVAFPESLAIRGDIDTTATLTGTMLKPMMSGKVTGGQGTVSLLSEKKETLKVRFNKLAADWGMKDQVLTIKQFTTTTFKGNLTGKASFQLAKTPIEYTVNVDGKGIDLEAFSNDNLGWMPSLIGTSQLAGSIRGTGNDVKAILGDGNLSLKNANFKKLPKFRDFLSGLGVSWIAEKAYDDVSASFKLENGRIKTNDMKANATYIRMNGVASLGFDATLNGSVNVSLEQKGLKGTKLEKVARKLAPGGQPLDVTLGVSGPLADLTWSTDLESMMKKALTRNLLDKFLGDVLGGRREETKSPAPGDQETAPKSQPPTQQEEEKPPKEPEEEESIEDKLKRKLLEKLFDF
ncbi:MAG: AsmA-like C-terminal region-containing protein [bacterium]|nr:AsmA-like C-terminal region-containing protein [bacterium]